MIKLIPLLAVALASCERRAPDPPPPQRAPSKPAPEAVPALPEEVCKALLPRGEIEKLAGVEIEPMQAAIFGGDPNECFVQWSDPAIKGMGEDNHVASLRAAVAGVENDEWKTWQQWVDDNPGRGYLKIERDLGLGNASLLAIAPNLTKKERDVDRRAADAAVEKAYLDAKGKLELNDLLEVTRKASTPKTHVLDIRAGAGLYHFSLSSRVISEAELRSWLPTLKERFAALTAGEPAPAPTEAQSSDRRE